MRHAGGYFHICVMWAGQDQVRSLNDVLLCICHTEHRADFVAESERAGYGLAQGDAHRILASHGKILWLMDRHIVLR